jgi:hypothetical protein
VFAGGPGFERLDGLLLFLKETQNKGKEKKR